jgi:hypothetical protein
MHTSYKELNNGIARKEGISNHQQNAVTMRATTIKNRDPAKDPKQNESRTRTESWHRVRKEEHEGESKRRVRKAVLAKFGCQVPNKSKKSEETKQRTSFLGRIRDSRSRCCRKIRGLYNAMNGQKAHM